MDSIKWILLTSQHNIGDTLMGSIKLEMIYIVSMSTSIEDAIIFNKKIVDKSIEIDPYFQGLVSAPVLGSNGLIQFTILPVGSKEGWPRQSKWEELVAYTAKSCVRTDFWIKRLYITEL